MWETLLVIWFDYGLDFDNGSWIQKIKITYGNPDTKRPLCEKLKFPNTILMEVAHKLQCKCDGAVWALAYEMQEANLQRDTFQAQRDINDLATTKEHILF